MTSAQLTGEAELMRSIAAMADDIALNGFKIAVRAGCRVVERSYVSILEKVATKPGGKFPNAFTGVGSKVAVFSHSNGVYGVIGTQRSGGKRVVPQVLFGERGTKARYTKAGDYRGIMPKQHWLERARSQSYDDARAVMMEKLKAYVAKYSK